MRNVCILLSMVLGSWSLVHASATDQAPGTKNLGPERRGAELAARVVKRQATSGYRLRARLVDTAQVEGPSGPVMLRVIGRTDRTSTRVVYQVVWPAARLGQAVSLERALDGNRASGFLLEPPDRVTPLDAALRARPFLGSDLIVEDLLDDFWVWPTQRYAGEATSDGRACEILESRPPAGSPSPYSLVRSWIAKSRAAPVKIEKYGRDDTLARRLAFVRADKRRDQPTPTRLIVERPGRTTSTTIEFFSSERGVEVPVSQFTLDHLKGDQGPRTKTRN